MRWEEEEAEGQGSWMGRWRIGLSDLGVVVVDGVGVAGAVVVVGAVVDESAGDDNMDHKHVERFEHEYWMSMPFDLDRLAAAAASRRKDQAMVLVRVAVDMTTVQLQ
jgi:hypothetical protein